MIERQISLGEFILFAELLEQAYAAPTPLPDYIAHKCEMAEGALSKLGARRGITGDAVLAELFALTLAGNRKRTLGARSG
jgi:hypothetical protein